MGFAAGLVIMTTCFTGAVLVFEEELQHSFHKERYFVNRDNVIQPIDSLVGAIRQKVPGALISGVKIYTDSSRSCEIVYTIKKLIISKPKPQMLKRRRQVSPPQKRTAVWLHI